MAVARSQAPEDRVELVLEGGPRPRMLQALRELWGYRTTLLTFAQRDVRVKYSQAALGVGWAVIQPLVLMGAFALAFGRRFSGDGVPYAAFTLSVLVPWVFIQTSVTFGTKALLRDAMLLRKVYFPREAAVLGEVLAAGVDLVVGLLLFAAFGPLLGAQISATWLLAPALVVLLVVLAAGISLVFGGFSVYYRDFEYVVQFLLLVWLFASPVVYPLSEVPAAWRGLYITLNPAAGILDSFRRVLALGQLPDGGVLLASCVVTLVLALVGFRVFKRLEPAFADVI